MYSVPSPLLTEGSNQQVRTPIISGQVNLRRCWAKTVRKECETLVNTVEYSARLDYLGTQYLPNPAVVLM